MPSLLGWLWGWYALYFFAWVGGVFIFWAFIYKDDMEGSVGGNVSLVGRLAIGMLGWFGS